MLYYVRLWIVLVMDISVYMLVSVFSEDNSVMKREKLVVQHTTSNVTIPADVSGLQPSYYQNYDK